MKYIASDNLANILLKFGFIETTEKIYPDHYSYMSKFGYESGKVKRRFDCKQSFCILFDYINIRGFGKIQSFSKTTLNEDDLLSVLMYANMDSTIKTVVKNRCNTILDIADHCRKISSSDSWNKAVKTNGKLEALYDKIAPEIRMPHLNKNKKR